MKKSRLGTEQGLSCGWLVPGAQKMLTGDGGSSPGSAGSDDPREPSSQPLLVCSSSPLIPLPLPSHVCPLCLFLSLAPLIEQKFCFPVTMVTIYLLCARLQSKHFAGISSSTLNNHLT